MSTIKIKTQSGSGGSTYRARGAKPPNHEKGRI